MAKNIEKNFIAIVSCLILLLLCYKTFFYVACKSMDLQIPGLLGDFVGGILGTILTAVAAIFVYRTYVTQREQLEQQKKEANQTLIDNLYDRISREIDGLEITYNVNKENGRQPELIKHNGIFVLYNFVELYKKDNSVLNQLNLILISFEHLFDLTNSATYKWNLQLNLNKDRNYLLFYTKIIWPFHRFYSTEWNKLIQDWNPPHPDSKGTKNRFEKLFKESYTYLLERELIGVPEDEIYKKLLGKI